MTSTGDEFCGACGHPKDDHDRDGCNTCPGDDGRAWSHAYTPETPAILNEPTPAGPRYTGRRVDELPPGVTGVVTVVERIVNPDALTPPPLGSSRTVPPIDLDTALNLLHTATEDAGETHRVADLDQQITAIIAGLLRFSSDPAGITSRALLIYPDNALHRVGALKRLVTWRTDSKAIALKAMTDAGTALQQMLTASPVPDEWKIEEGEALLNAQQSGYEIFSAALDAAKDAFLNDPYELGLSERPVTVAPVGSACISPNCGHRPEQHDGTRCTVCGTRHAFQTLGPRRTVRPAPGETIITDPPRKDS